MAQLDEQVRQDVKMLQLAGNKSLEHLLKFVNDKLRQCWIQDSVIESLSRYITSQTFKRLFLKVNISGKELFLYDTGSQFSITTRDDYNRLPTKPPLQKVEQSGVGIDGSKFAFDGIVYLNLVLSNEEGKHLNFLMKQC